MSEALAVGRKDASPSLGFDALWIFLLRDRLYRLRLGKWR